MSGRAARYMAVIVLALATCEMVPERATAGCRDQTPTSWDVQAAPDSEPGERLVLTGRVISRKNGSPLPGITVYVYHADSHGDYVPPGHEKEPPRLCGILITNAKGEYRVRTSMPGGYEGYAPHIHFEVWGPNVARQFSFVNLKLSPGTAPQGVRLDTSATASLTSPKFTRPPANTAMERPVHKGADGILRCTRDLEVEVKPTLLDEPKPPGLGSPR